ncbi:hypothetical protein SPRG_03704 [Saprolegnia parasitica CBS 223.65]|uniref:Major facilitator superfamily (MFS) profile domain-containing protein n=1 Tax=Saprolegnia parasitica (strain CBS 223.65) TaxID=695850 RepID=A0A067CM77_SAPPC|nr:hypothetical protein SPRG_03704 [Saprolegnia parasitica CBS 223.65]KDO31784.1 hypothetical protein SPRG_03704 [Saprolegnia parasitica CBS 223.65]|eukprot:XP_012197664.1 hypothetical protein SPRG_03704 [Saprolegnia parasitica CBS 223.65]
MQASVQLPRDDGIDGKGPDECATQRRTRQWHTQLGLISFVIFGAEASRGITMPTLFPYCQSLGGDLYLMGLLTSVFSLGRLISSTVFGYLCDKYSFRAVYIASSVIGLIGNILYLLPHPHTLLLSRFLVGVSSGNLSVCRADVAAKTHLEHRLKYLTMLALMVYLGYALTPGIGGLLSNVDWTVAGLHIDAYTVPGVILAALSALSLLLIVCLYDDSISVEDAPEAKLKTRTVTAASSFVLSDTLVYTGVVLFIFLNIVARGVLSIYETINVPLFAQVTGEKNTTMIAAASAFQFHLGLLGLVAYFAIEVWHRAVSDVAWLVGGFLALGIGNLILAVRTTPTYVELWFGVFFLWSVGSPITTAVCVSAMSKILGTRQQGKWMGLLGSAASLSRIVMPMLPALFASSFTPLFFINVGLCIVAMTALLAFDLIVKRAKAMAPRAAAIVPIASQAAT